MSIMTIADQIDRNQFERDGYFIVNDILSNHELSCAGALFDAWLPADAQPPLVSGEKGVQLNGRKALMAQFCEPHLANFAGHPRLIEAADALLGSPLRIHQAPVPVATHKSPPGAENFDLGYHVDWPHNPPEPGDERYVNCVLHFSTVEPGGGAFMLRPGSHQFVEQYLADPALRARVLAQDFNNLPGLPEPMEMCVPAGSAVFFHAFLVHDRSENVRDAPRQVMFVHFLKCDDPVPLDASTEDSASRFHADHVRAMDDRMKKLCGIQPRRTTL
jgi:ectoine hydroxylase-related dioxygenase (phytanoyl-CoA dioxygenase family)